MKKLLIFGILVVALLSLAACTSSSSSAAAVEAFYTALVEGDSASVSQLACADWEPQAKLFLDSFTGVKARLENMTCTELDNSGSSATVNCTGKIIATYGTEDQEIDLSGMAFALEKQGDTWLLCGQK